MSQSILHLTLKKKWFDMIASGEKIEEYRDVKQYWINRLFEDGLLFNDLREYDIIRFRNGYAKKCPEIDIEYKGAEHRGKTIKSNEKWGAQPNTEYIVIKLGKILSIKNYK